MMTMIFVRGVFTSSARQTRANARRRQHHQMLLAIGLLVLHMLVLAGVLALEHSARRTPVPASVLGARRELWF
jgi:hypothetical protein